MDKAQQLKYLKAWGFKTKASCEKHIRETMEDLEFIAPQLFKMFKDKVKEWEREFLRDGRKRFVAEAISPPGDRLVRGAERVLDKMFYSWAEHDRWKEETGKKREKGAPQRYDPKHFLGVMTDLIRFRIECNYLSDVYYIDKKIQAFVQKSKTIEQENRDDHIETPFPERRVGHRAMQYVFRYSANTQSILFEVQVMTQLQHAWDKKDHHLIYEPVREGRGKEIPLHLRNRMAAMSELLSVADTAFEELRINISRVTEKG